MRELRLAVLGVLLVAASTSIGAVETDVPRKPGPNPWTHLDFKNDPSSFHFAVVSDRTGGLRPGVFDVAVQKLNLLRPAFVLCIGDLVEGNAKDESELDAQWDEFDRILLPLEAPFFFVPGNHDVSNTEFGPQVWSRRHGRLYYHFVYDQVLFVCLNSDDGGLERIGDEQYEYIRQTLEAQPDVRWTFVFMHKPLWAMEDAQGWDRVEQLLGPRPHTVFTGHTHEYLKYDRNGRDYLVLATTGGGMAHHGLISGEFDEVVWVTMEEDGPQLANLLLEGILDKNVRTERTASLSGPLLDGGAVDAPPLVVAGPQFESGTVEVKLSNPAEIPLRVAGTIDPSVQLLPDITQIDRTLPPRGEQTIRVTLQAPQPADVRSLQPLATRWTLTYDQGASGLLAVPFTGHLVVDSSFTCAKAARPVKADGALDDWEELPFVCIEPAETVPDGRTWEGPGDCSFRFNVTHDDVNLYVGVRVIDDRKEAGPKPKSKRRDFITVCLDGRQDAEPSPNGEEKHIGNDRERLTIAFGPGGAPGEVASFGDDDPPPGIELGSAWDEGGYSAELAVPVEYLEVAKGKAWQRVQVNVGATDFDSASDTGVTVWWRPEWSSNPNSACGNFSRAD